MGGVQSDLVAQIADLRRVRAALGPGHERRELGRVIRQMRASLGIGIPKRRAADLLGITPQALDRWVQAGKIRVLRKPGSSRELVDRDLLIRLLTEVRSLREAGVKRPMSDALRAAGALPARPSRLNQSAAELRYEFLNTTPYERVRNTVVLSRTAHTMASHARARDRGTR